MLDIDADVLQAAKAIAATKGKSAGKVLSELARRGLAETRAEVTLRNGMPLLLRPPATPPLTIQDVNAVRDGE